MDRAQQTLRAAGATEGNDGQLEIGGETIEFNVGYVSLPWLGSGRNEAAERAGMELAKDQKAILAEERILGLWGPRGGIFYPPDVATDQMS